MLEEEEGRERFAYTDSEGYLTIGVGRLIDKRKGGGLSDEEIDFLKANDIKRVKKEVQTALPWMLALNEARQAVLYGMCFQMGLGSEVSGKGLLGFRNTLAAIRDEHFEHAAELMLQSRWARQTPKRAKRMSVQIATGEWQ